MSNIFTRSERTEKRYTVGQAVAAAKARLMGNPERRQPLPLCMNAVRQRDYREAITLAELNEISDALVSDSCFYGYS